MKHLLKKWLERLTIEEEVKPRKFIKLKEDLILARKGQVFEVGAEEYWEFEELDATVHPDRFKLITHE